jgi:hypothetical protein
VRRRQGASSPHPPSVRPCLHSRERCWSLLVARAEDAIGRYAPAAARASTTRMGPARSCSQ